MTNRIDVYGEFDAPINEPLQKGKRLTPDPVLKLPKEPDFNVMCANCREIYNGKKFDRCICGSNETV